VEGNQLEENKKKAARLGAHLIFIDESGFMLTPCVRKTWAPVGQTPIMHHRFANDRISVISGVSISPTRRRLGRYGLFFWNNIGQEEVVLFLHEVLRHLRGHVIALLDNSNTHRGKPIRDLCDRFPRLHLEHFPPYAPEMNPDEGVWGLLKRNLANGRPDNIGELGMALQREFRTLAESQSKLRGCVRQSNLSISLV
jgi:putative transposase